MTMENEKRKTPRINKVLVTRYSPIQQEADSWDAGTLKNISTGGILLFTNKIFNKGEMLKVLIKIPFDPLHWLETNGEVVESKKNTTRIRFLDLGETQKKLITDYIAWFIKREEA